MAWVIIAVVAFASTSASADALSSEFNLPGRESSEAAALIYEQYGNGGHRVSGPLVPVVRAARGHHGRHARACASSSASAFATMAAAIPGSRSADFASTGDRVFVSKDGRTTFGVIWYPPSDVAFDARRRPSPPGPDGGGGPQGGRARRSGSPASTP